MKNFDAVIERQSIRGLGAIEVARMISAAPRRDRRLPELDAATLKDLGFDNSSR